MYSRQNKLCHLFIFEKLFQWVNKFFLFFIQHKKYSMYTRWNINTFKFWKIKLVNHHMNQLLIKHCLKFSFQIFSCTFVRSTKQLYWKQFSKKLIWADWILQKIKCSSTDKKTFRIIRILQGNHFSARILQESHFSARILQDRPSSDK